MVKQQQIRIDPEKLGIPRVDNTPMGIIEMQGNVYRGIMNKGNKRPKWVRVIAIFTSFFLLLLPGGIYLFISVPSYFENGLVSIIAPLSIGLLFLTAGILGIYVNSRK